MRRPLGQFAQALGAETPAAAMRLACEGLRQRVRAAGWTPGLDAYVRAFGLRVEEAPIPTAGRLDHENGGYVVRVQRTRHRGESGEAGPPRPPTPLRVADATNRQRFTIAHEIGHALLLESLRGRPDALAALHDPAAWADVEALCDEAAAELLVPHDELLPLAGQLGISMRGLDRLADRFRVAHEIIYARLLAAGALSLSLWRAADAPPAGRVRVKFERVLAKAPAQPGRRGGGLPILRASSWLIPDIVKEAALHGRAQVVCLAVKSGEASWLVAGVAACHRPLGTRAEQPPLLEPAAGPDAPGDSAPADTLVTLLLLPTEAAAATTPLWAVLTVG